jgi:hypothetical protein
MFMRAGRENMGVGFYRSQTSANYSKPQEVVTDWIIVI